LLVKVVPGKNLVASPGQEGPAGYYQRFGITAESETEMIRAVQDYIDHDIGGQIIEVENQGELDFDGSDSDMTEFTSDVEVPGFWYISGRAFYIHEDRDSGTMADRLNS